LRADRSPVDRSSVSVPYNGKVLVRKPRQSVMIAQIFVAAARLVAVDSIAMVFQKSFIVFL
jgi:hypothetical protein